MNALRKTWTSFTTPLLPATLVVGALVVVLLEEELLVLADTWLFVVELAGEFVGVNETKFEFVQLVKRAVALPVISPSCLVAVGVQ